MKKFYFLAAATITLVSCSNEESVFDPQPPQEIAFNAIAKNSSRAAVTSSSNWIAPINVAAAAKANDATSYSNHFSPNNFVTFKPKTGVWYVDGSTKYYYLPNGYIDFLAYASGGEETSPSNEVAPEASFEKNTDGRFTSLTLNYKADGHQLGGNTDVMYALTTGFPCPTTGNPTLAFKHALAWLSVRIIDPDATLKISTVKVNNVYLTGSMTVPINYDGSGNGSFGNPGWNIDGVTPMAELGFPAYCPGTPTLVGSLGETVGLLVVPQAQTSITVQYELSHSPGNLFTQTFDLSSYDPWDANMHYTYVISMNNFTEITFTCTIDSYGNTETPLQP